MPGSRGGRALSAYATPVTPSHRDAPTGQGHDVQAADHPAGCAQSGLTIIIWAVFAGSVSTRSLNRSSIRAIMLASNRIPAAAAFSDTCSGRDAPMIAELTPLFCSVH